MLLTYCKLVEKARFGLARQLLTAARARMGDNDLADTP